MALVIRVEEAFAPTDPDDLLPVPEFFSSDGFELMEDFAGEQSDPEVRSALLGALDRRKPFREFKDALFDFPEVREAWVRYKAEKMAEIAEAFYAEEGIEVVWKQRPGAKP